jgi:hypothetical protein
MEDKLMDEVIRLFEPMGFSVADIRSTVQQLIEVPLPSLLFHSPLASLSHPHPSVFFTVQELRPWPKDRNFSGNIDAARGHVKCVCVSMQQG